MKLALLTILLLGIVYSQSEIQYVPITEHYDGLTIGEPDAPFHIEAFFDLMCPDSTTSNNYLNKALQEIQFENQNQVQITYHIFPLPYHYTAFYFAQGFRYIHDNFNKQQQKEYINLILDNQAQFVNSKTQDYDQSGIFDEMTQFVSEKLDFVSAQDFRAALDNKQYNTQARYSMKFGLGLHITGTPIFLANGVIATEAADYNTKDWVNFIKEHTNL